MGGWARETRTANVPLTFVMASTDWSNPPSTWGTRLRVLRARLRASVAAGRVDDQLMAAFEIHESAADTRRGTMSARAALMFSGVEEIVLEGEERLLLIPRGRTVSSDVVR